MPNQRQSAIIETIYLRSATTSRVGIVYHPFYLEHETGHHLECPQRLQVLLEVLGQQGLLERLVPLKPLPASLQQVLLVHRPALVQRLKGLAQSGGGAIDLDTVMSRGSFRAALTAAGGIILAAEAVLDNEVENAFALVRPPGHHATPSEAMGFCLFNNVAIAAAHLIQNRQLKRVLIIDFDAHHGNGTQEIFYTDPRVLYFSVHQFPWYPGTGDLDEVGTGAGHGYTVNLPFPPGCGDAVYVRAFHEVLVPVARRFKPQMILLSAGYDAHLADPLSLLRVTTSGYAHLVSIINDLAQELCAGRLALVLEGGYNLTSLTESVAITFQALLGLETNPPLVGPDPERDRSILPEAVIDTAKAIHGL